MKYKFILISVFMLATTSVFATGQDSPKGCLYSKDGSKLIERLGSALVCCATPASKPGASETITSRVPIDVRDKCPASDYCKGQGYTPSNLCNQDIGGLLRKHPLFAYPKGNLFK